MQRKFLRLFLAIGVVSFVSGSCTKIDTTKIGQDLLPAVDNVHTFADTLSVTATQGVLSPDTTRISIGDVHVLGSTSNDPLFGKTDARVYLELKPGFFPYYFGNRGDTIAQSFAPAGTGFDSVVLCLSYKGFYGDSSRPQHLRVLEMSDAETNFKPDSSYQTNYQPAVAPSNILGETTLIPADLKNYTFLDNRKDSVNYQVRIPLNASFLTRILANSDSTSGKTFSSDSLFKTVFKGFAIQTDGSSDNNGLFYVSLTDANTRLEIHYRRKHGAPIDTAHSSWGVVSLRTGVSNSATANYINRNRQGSQYETPASNEIFIQTTPGTYANLLIPGLDTFKNSIIHRAELVMEEIPSAVTSLSAPSFLYVDVTDTGSFKYKPLPYDLNPSAYYNPNTSAQPFYPTNGIDFGYFGGNKLTKVDQLTGMKMNYYVFNISRYVQGIVTKKEKNYGLRVSAPYDLLYYGYRLPFSNRLAYGGVKLGSGNNPNYRMRLRIVYSKI